MSVELIEATVASPIERLKNLRKKWIDNYYTLNKDEKLKLRVAILWAREEVDNERTKK